MLSAGSAYFQAMFTGGLAEETQASVEIKSISPGVLAQLVNFIYTGKTNNSAIRTVLFVNFDFSKSDIKYEKVQ